MKTPIQFIPASSETVLRAVYGTALGELDAYEIDCEFVIECKERTFTITPRIKGIRAPGIECANDIPPAHLHFQLGMLVQRVEEKDLSAMG